MSTRKLLVARHRTAKSCVQTIKAPRRAEHRDQRTKPFDPPSYNSTISFGNKIIQVAKNKHVPISNIFITLPTSIKTSTSKRESFYSCNSRSRTRPYPEKTLYSFPSHTSFPRDPNGKDKKGKKELRWLDAECVAFF